MNIRSMLNELSYLRGNKQPIVISQSVIRDETVHFI